MIIKALPIIKYFFQSNIKGRAYPYEATNYGSLIAKNEWLAFLDATTIPKKNWIKDYVEIIKSNKAEIVFGNTQYLLKRALDINLYKVTDLFCDMEICRIGNSD